jgi:hypothetical protein
MAAGYERGTFARRNSKTQLHRISEKDSPTFLRGTMLERWRAARIHLKSLAGAKCLTFYALLFGIVLSD